MTWSCKACTFDNGADKAIICAVCGTKRLSKSTAINYLSEARGRKLEQSNKLIDLKDKNLALIDGIDLSKIPITKKKKRGEGGEDIMKIDEEGPRKKQRTRGMRNSDSTQLVKSKVDESRKVSMAHFDVLKAEAQKKMKRCFGIASLRKLQPVAVDLALKQKSQIIIMATGGGKSLCYQLPAAVLGGVTLVISPLIALMVDQVQKLNEKGIPAALVSSANGERNNREVMERLLGRRMNNNKTNKEENKALKPINLLYGTPELLLTERFRKILTELHQRNGLALFALDEAHCLSSWGHDFRPAYRKLRWLRTSFPNIPCMACTATATPKVISDIREVLLLNKEDVPCNISSFNRPNISYEVRYKDSLDAMRPGGAIGDLIQLIKVQHEQATKESTPCSGIVYVHRRQDTSYIAEQISMAAGIKAAPYHAGLKNSERNAVQKNWTDGKIKIAVATVAFGMGIDLAHVRYVVHWSMAKTVEGFYQESGRAGRDGGNALSALYYSKEDFKRFEYIVRKSMQHKGKDKVQTDDRFQRKHPIEALEQMKKYCIIPDCRRRFLLAHFGEEINPTEICKKTCDYCKNPSKVQKAINTSDVVRDVLKSAATYNRSIRKDEWDGQWDQPHGEDECNEFSDGWKDGDLIITAGSGDQDSYTALNSERKGFAKASSILSNYRKMEEREFDNKASKSRHIEIPEHLRDSLPNPLSQYEKKPKNKSNNESSSMLENRVAQLRENLKKLKAQRVAKSEAQKAKAKTVAKAPPPPALSFKFSKN